MRDARVFQFGTIEIMRGNSKLNTDESGWSKIMARQEFFNVRRGTNIFWNIGVGLLYHEYHRYRVCKNRMCCHVYVE